MSRFDPQEHGRETKNLIAIAALFVLSYLSVFGIYNTFSDFHLVHYISHIGTRDNIDIANDGGGIDDEGEGDE